MTAIAPYYATGTNQRNYGLFSMPKCISYKVNPDQLNAGIPIDQLEKQNLRIIKPVHDENLWNKGISLSRDTKYEPPENTRENSPVSHTIYRVSPVDYAAVIRGKAINIPPHFSRLIGEKFCIINERNLKTFRLMVLNHCIGNKGYFA